MDEKIEKNSPTLGRMATYTKTSRISRLPSYLTVQFIRHYWKPERNIAVKILRKVRFPMELDAVEFCTDELKNKILPLKCQLLELESSKVQKHFIFFCQIHLNIQIFFFKKKKLLLC